MGNQIGIKMIKEINDSNYKEETNSGFVLVDCYASWCKPCKVMIPILEEIDIDYEDVLSIKKLNVDTNEKTIERLDIQSMPTFLIYKDGKIVDKIVGSMSKAKLEDIIKTHI